MQDRVIVNGKTYVRAIGKIRETFLGFQDHGILTAWLTIEDGLYTQGTPAMMGFEEPKPGMDYKDPKNRQGSAFGMEFVRRIIKAVGVEKWEDLMGRTIVILRDTSDRNIMGIENLPTERGERVMFGEVIKQFFPELGGH